MSTNIFSDSNTSNKAHWKKEVREGLEKTIVQKIAPKKRDKHVEKMYMIERSEKPWNNNLELKEEE
ncbi:hypothetical protein M513_12865 [Trichuris suis]|uniref:Uncharacterized protein n=1 Tax=Trichuris suis TaxID=68888 RepID=A0A085LMQ1_9BILA|nr:hypothetical protein M513_12865 [Trichuris suis]